MLTLNNITKRYGLRRVLDKVSFSVGEGQKVAIVGTNGSGKSTLLRIIAGVESFERGKRTIPNRILIGYLPQETPPLARETVKEYLERMTGIAGLREAIEREVALVEDKQAQKKYEEAAFEYERLGGEQFAKKAHRHLQGLKLKAVSFNTLTTELSGGQKRKLALTAVLLKGVDLLVLDEPTNNLDLPALLYLEKYLQEGDKTVVLASHDRTFLDNVVSKVFEIDFFTREVHQYAGDYSDYVEMKAHRIRRQRELFREQEEEKTRLSDSREEKKEWVQKLKVKKRIDSDKMAHHFKKERATKKFDASAKSLETRLKKLRDHEAPQDRKPPTLKLQVTDEERGAFIAKKLVVGYEQGFQSQPLSFEWTFGTRIALLGDNGSGKTTLLKTLAGVLAPLTGRLEKEGVIIGYFIQEHETIDLTEKVSAYLKQKSNGTADRDSMLEQLRLLELPPDRLDDDLEDLSPGERVRIIFAGLALAGVNTLFLDEPTNHLDLDAVEALEETLLAFTGTLIVVSHDRTFLKNLKLDQVLTLKDGALTAR